MTALDPVWTEIKVWFKNPQLFCSSWGTEETHPDGDGIVPRDAYCRLMAGYCRPILDYMADHGSLKSYHVFFETEPHWLFRIESDRPGIAEVAANDRFADIRHFSDRMEVAHGKYRGEEGRYGRDGWPLAKAFFQAVADVAIARVDPGADVRPWDESGQGFSISKLVHCLVQPTLGGGERLFYIQRMLESSGGALMYPGPRKERFLITIPQR